MTATVFCTECAEDAAGHRRCPHCWAAVTDPITLAPRAPDQVVTPLERRLNLRLRALLDDMHDREIRERAAALARTSG